MVEQARGERETVPWADYQRRVMGEDGRYPDDTPFLPLQGPMDHEPARRIEAYAEWHPVGDDSNGRIAAIRSQAAELRIFGGQVWAACGEPCWHYNDGGFHRHGAYLSLEFGDANDMPSDPENWCRADRIEAFLDLKCGDGYRPRQRDRLDILLPSAFRLSFEDPALMNAVNEAKADIARRTGEASVEDFRVFADLRDAYAANPREPTEELVAAIEVILACDAWHTDTRGLTEAYTRWRGTLNPGAPASGVTAFGR